jgi:hypothetical protein
LSTKLDDRLRVVIGVLSCQVRFKYLNLITNIRYSFIIPI